MFADLWRGKALRRWLRLLGGADENGFRLRQGLSQYLGGAAVSLVSWRLLALLVSSDLLRLSRLLRPL